MDQTALDRIAAAQDAAVANASPPPDLAGATPLHCPQNPDGGHAPTEEVTPSNYRIRFCEECHYEFSRTYAGSGAYGNWIGA